VTVIDETGEQDFKNLQLPQPAGLGVEKGAELLIIKESILSRKLSDFLVLNPGLYQERSSTCGV
jgi:hypothetical protein